MMLSGRRCLLVVVLDRTSTSTMSMLEPCHGCGWRGGGYFPAIFYFARSACLPPNPGHVEVVRSGRRPLHLSCLQSHQRQGWMPAQGG